MKTPYQTLKISAGIAFVATLFLFQSDAHATDHQVTITSAEPDLVTNTLLISGDNLGTGASFDGTLSLYTPLTGTAPLNVASFSASDQEIVANLPAGIASLPGTYLLTVVVGHGSKSTTTFDVAIGTIGLTGTQGPQGAPGAVGPVGPSGPAGEQGVTGVAGPQGFTGLQGPMGATGPKGEKGDPGGFDETDLNPIAYNGMVDGVATRALATLVVGAKYIALDEGYPNGSGGFLPANSLALCTSVSPETWVALSAPSGFTVKSKADYSIRIKQVAGTWGILAAEPPIGGVATSFSALPATPIHLPPGTLSVDAPMTISGTARPWVSGPGTEQTTLTLATAQKAIFECTASGNFNRGYFGNFSTDVTAGGGVGDGGVFYFPTEGSEKHDGFVFENIYVEGASNTGQIAFDFGANLNRAVLRNIWMENVETAGQFTNVAGGNCLLDGMKVTTGSYGWKLANAGFNRLSSLNSDGMKHWTLYIASNSNWVGTLNCEENDVTQSPALILDGASNNRIDSCNLPIFATTGTPQVEIKNGSYSNELVVFLREGTLSLDATSCFNQIVLYVDASDPIIGTGRGTSPYTDNGIGNRIEIRYTFGLRGPVETIWRNWSDDSLPVNGDFFSWNGTVPSGWNTPVGAMAQDNSGAGIGTGINLRITPTAGSTGRLTFPFTNLGPLYEQLGRTFTARALVKKTAVGGASVIRLQARPGVTFAPSNSHLSVQTISDGNVHELVVTGKVDVDATDPGLRLQVDAGTGSAYVADFTICWDSKATRTVARGQVLRNSVAYDPPALPVNTRDSIQTMTVVGAAVGAPDPIMSFSADRQGLSLKGYVSAPNTVSYYFENDPNNPAGTVDLPSGTVTATLQRQSL